MGRWRWIWYGNSETLMFKCRKRWMKGQRCPCQVQCPGTHRVLNMPKYCTVPFLTGGGAGGQFRHGNNEGMLYKRVDGCKWKVATLSTYINIHQTQLTVRQQLPSENVGAPRPLLRVSIAVMCRPSHISDQSLSSSTVRIWSTQRWCVNGHAVTPS